MSLGLGRIVMQYGKEKVYSGRSYRVGGARPQIANLASVVLHIKTKNEEMHCSFIGGCSGNAEALLYESPTITALGTPVPAKALNRIRGTDDGCAASFFIGSNYSNRGATLIDMYMFGGEKNFKVGAEGEAGDEWMLGKNTSYLMRVKNISAAAADVWMALSFYED